MASLRVVRPGMLTTVQDLGRWGHQDAGVPVAGPMDVYSHRRANRLAGNPDGTAALEVTLIGPELESDSEIVCAIAGARFAITVDGHPVDANGAFVAHAGARVRFGARHSGARATLAVRGGFDVPQTLGSRATSLVSRMGPFGGRALAAGDVLPVGAAAGIARRKAGPAMPLPAGGAHVRVVLGPHDALFTREAVDTLLGSRFTVTPQSNRMGYRLEGPALRRVGSADILSDATPFGSLQVPASGQPILLMADRQTTGGYPKVATVISADLPLAGQLAPGDWVQFTACTPDAARAALRAQEATLSGDDR
jgi:antagonist of KipI